LARSSARDIEKGHPPFKTFADPDEGYSIRFIRSGTGFNTKYQAHQLVPRDEPIPQEYLDQAYQLDQLIHIPTYAEVKAAFWGEDLVEAKQPERKQPSARTAQATSRGTKTRGTSPSPRGSSAGKKTTRGIASRRPKDEPEASDFGPEDELPEDLKSISDEGELVCPHGGEFGIDAYNLEQCDTCDLWEQCCQVGQHIEASGELKLPSPEDYEPLDDELDENEPQPPKTSRRGRGRATTTSKSNGSSRRSGRQASKPPARAVIVDEETSPPTGRGRGTRGVTRGSGRSRGRGIVR
jgi:hypothetical protein